MHAVTFHTMFTRKVYIIACVLSAVMTWQNVLNVWITAGKRLHPSVPFIMRNQLLIETLGTASVGTTELRGLVVEDGFLHFVCVVVMCVEGLRAGISPLAYVMFSHFSNGVFPLFCMNQYEQWMQYKFKKEIHTLAALDRRAVTNDDGTVEHPPEDASKTQTRLNVIPFVLYALITACQMVYVVANNRPKW
eukprot:PhF_6_TR18950/c0_g1_i3/m.27785